MSTGSIDLDQDTIDNVGENFETISDNTFDFFDTLGTNFFVTVILGVVFLCLIGIALHFMHKMS